MYAEQVVSAEEGEPHRQEIYEFIQKRLPEVSCMMITQRKDGRPAIRQVGAHVEGWTVGTITQSTHVKNKHVERNPIVTYLWTSLAPTEHRMVQNVWVQGHAEIIKDPEVVTAFMERRREFRGVPISPPKYERWLIKTTIDYVRAEGFTGPRRPVILTTFP